MAKLSKKFDPAATGAEPSYTRADLHQALQQDDVPLVRKILDSGQIADLESRDDRNWTPLLMALNKNRRECVLMLLDHGVTINPVVGNMGETPLTYAVGDYYGASPVMVSLLLARGANPNLLPVNPQDGPLLKAAKDGKEAITMLLLDHGAHIEQGDTWGNTAVSIAAENGHAGVIRILAAHGANLDSVGSASETPLEKAIRSHSREAFEALLECGANPTPANKEGRTLLMAAAERGETGVMERLLQAGLDIDYQDKAGKTALMYAAEAGKREAARKLMELGADITPGGAETARALAENKGHFHVVQEMDAVQKRLDLQRVPARPEKPFKITLGGK